MILAEHDIDNWLASIKGKVLVAGYGSLLSRSSRERFSQIYTPSIPVSIEGWQRAWVTRAFHEQQTYVGAFPNADSVINAQLIPLDINPSFQTRERDYRFTLLDKGQVYLNSVYSVNNALQIALQAYPIYICETLSRETASDCFPINFSYIATCMAGAEEGEGEKGLQNFISLTCNWYPEYIRRDDKAHLYPRSAILDQQQTSRYVALLKNRAILL